MSESTLFSAMEYNEEVLSNFIMFHTTMNYQKLKKI